MEGPCSHSCTHSQGCPTLSCHHALRGLREVTLPAVCHHRAQSPTTREDQFHPDFTSSGKPRPLLENSHELGSRGSANLHIQGEGWALTTYRLILPREKCLTRAFHMPWVAWGGESGGSTLAPSMLTGSFGGLAAPRTGPFLKGPHCTGNKLPEGRTFLSCQSMGPLAKCLPYSRCLLTTYQMDGGTGQSRTSLPWTQNSRGTISTTTVTPTAIIIIAIIIIL